MNKYHKCMYTHIYIYIYIWQRPKKSVSPRDGRTDGQTGGRMDGRTDGRAGGRTSGRTDRRTVGRMIVRTVGRAVGRTDGQAGLVTCWETDFVIFPCLGLMIRCHICLHVDISR